MKNIGHMWVREYGKKKKTHWHLVLLLDGNKVSDSWSVVALAINVSSIF